MEDVPGTCNLYESRPSFCCELTRQDDESIEGFVREAIVSLLGGCHRRRCRALDVGANNGWMSSYMLDLGAHVISVEPQVDLAAAVRATAALNCWEDRSIVFNNFACSCSNSSTRCFDGHNKLCLRPKVPSRKLWRAEGLAEGPKPSSTPRSSRRRARRNGQRSKANVSGIEGGAQRIEQRWEQNVTGIGIDDLIFYGTHSRKAPHHVDLIKLDGDGPEFLWLRAVEQLLSKHNLLTIDAMIVEVQLRDTTSHALNMSRIKWARTFAALQQKHGFEFYRLDQHDFRRLLTSTGWDAFSPPGTIGKLGRVRGALARDAVEDELFGVRAMRHLFRIKNNLSMAEWDVVLTPMNKRMSTLEVLLVHQRVGLVERRYGWGGLPRVSPEAKSAGWFPSAQGHHVHRKG